MVNRAEVQVIEGQKTNKILNQEKSSGMGTYSVSAIDPKVKFVELLAESILECMAAT